MSPRRVACVWVLATAVLGCSKNDDTPAVPLASASGSAATTKGLSAPENDQLVVAAVKKITAACATKWHERKGYDRCLDPMKELSESKVHAAAMTCLNLVEDVDPKVHRSYRSSAIRYLKDLDVEEGKKLAQKLTGDPERSVSDTAKDILAG